MATVSGAINAKAAPLPPRGVDASIQTSVALGEPPQQSQVVEPYEGYATACKPSGTAFNSTGTAGLETLTSSLTDSLETNAASNSVWRVFPTPPRKGRKGIA